MAAPSPSNCSPTRHLADQEILVFRGVIAGIDTGLGRTMPVKPVWCLILLEFTVAAVRLPHGTAELCDVVEELKPALRNR